MRKNQCSWGNCLKIWQDCAGTFGWSLLSCTFPLNVGVWWWERRSQVLGVRLRGTSLNENSSDLGTSGLFSCFRMWKAQLWKYLFITGLTGLMVLCSLQWDLMFWCQRSQLNHEAALYLKANWESYGNKYTVRNAVKLRDFNIEDNSGHCLDLADALQDKTVVISFLYAAENTVCMTTHCATSLLNTDYFKYLADPVSWFNPSQQLSTRQLLAHSPTSGIGKENWKGGNWKTCGLR